MRLPNVVAGQLWFISVLLHVCIPIHEYVWPNIMYPKIGLHRLMVVSRSQATFLFHIGAGKIGSGATPLEFLCCLSTQLE